ncbi:DUF2480 family protein [Flavobacteriaceae bacterium F08102]|nr:DUF2480 family protein [Flavobacteriaceae bacterium F08102]
MGEIVNRVDKSPLITVDLEDFYPAGNRMVIDIMPWLHEGLILREKEFRTHVQNHDWQQYKDHFVALTCSSDAIIPSWAYLLIITRLASIAKKSIVGDLTTLEIVLYQEIIDNLPLESYRDKPVIIKGCAHKPIPIAVSGMLVEKLQPVVKSIMFGEACSTVPLYKK